MHGEVNRISQKEFTCLQPLGPASDEWAQTTLAGKVEILKKFLDYGNILQELIIAYKEFYLRIQKVDVPRHVTDGLIELLNYVLDDQTTNGLASNG